MSEKSANHQLRADGTWCVTSKGRALYGRMKSIRKHWPTHYQSKRMVSDPAAPVSTVVSIHAKRCFRRAWKVHPLSGILTAIDPSVVEPDIIRKGDSFD